MSKRFLSITLTALALCCFASSCVKEKGFEERVTEIAKTDELSTRIATVGEQVKGMEKSITQLQSAQEKLEQYAVKLGQDLNAAKTDITTNAGKIATLQTELTNVEASIETIKGSIKTLEDGLSELRTYVNDTVAGVRNWANATFATIETTDGIATRLTAAEGRIQSNAESLRNFTDTVYTTVYSQFRKEISDSLASAETRIKSWVNKQLTGYWTIAQTKWKLDSVARAVEVKDSTALSDSLRKASEDLTTAYKAAIKTSIDSLAGAVNDTINNRIKRANDILDAKITAIDTRLTALEKTVENLVARIQKIDVIPQYNDGSVWMSKKDTVVKFIVRPDSIAKKLAAAHPTGDSTFTFLAVKTLTKSDGNPDTLDIKEVSYKDGIVSVKVNGSKLDSLYFEGEQSYSGCLVIGDGNSDNASGFFPLYYVRADLSTNGTSNCYIVSKAGDYKIKATVKGNCADSVIAPSAVSVLWESFGTSTTPASGDLVKDITLSSNGYVYFSASEKKGNAVIAAKDGSGTILWSWHIWLTDQPGEQEYKNNAGTMMDRNLGATSADKGQVSALGLLYQWGRKDPFLGSSSKNSSILAASTLSWPSPENTSYHLSNNNALAYSISNPTTFLKNESAPYDWYCISATYKNDSLWNVSSGKTIYDPCPVGYRVPKGGSGGIWAKAGIPSKGTFDSTNRGMDFATYTTSIICWYPAAGFRNHGGSLVNVGTYTYYGSFTTKGNDSYCLYFFSSGGIYTSQDATRARGYSVRCVKE